MFYVRARAYLDLGDIEEAVAHFEKAASGYRDKTLASVGWPSSRTSKANRTSFSSGTLSHKPLYSDRIEERNAVVAPAISPSELLEKDVRLAFDVLDDGHPTVAGTMTTFYPDSAGMFYKPLYSDRIEERNAVVAPAISPSELSCTSCARLWDNSE
jgi:hypothetical protein